MAQRSNTILIWASLKKLWYWKLREELMMTFSCYFKSLMFLVLGLSQLTSYHANIPAKQEEGKVEKRHARLSAEKRDTVYNVDPQVAGLGHLPGDMIERYYPPNCGLNQPTTSEQKLVKNSIRLKGFKPTTFGRTLTLVGLDKTISTEQIVGIQSKLKETPDWRVNLVLTYVEKGVMVYPDQIVFPPRFASEKKPLEALLFWSQNREFLEEKLDAAILQANAEELFAEKWIADGLDKPMALGVHELDEGGVGVVIAIPSPYSPDRQMGKGWRVRDENEHHSGCSIKLCIFRDRSLGGRTDIIESGRKGLVSCVLRFHHFDKWEEKPIKMHNLDSNEEFLLKVPGPIMKREAWLEQFGGLESLKNLKLAKFYDPS